LVPVVGNPVAARDRTWPNWLLVNRLLRLLPACALALHGRLPEIRSEFLEFLLHLLLRVALDRLGYIRNELVDNVLDTLGSHLLLHHDSAWPNPSSKLFTGYVVMQRLSSYRKPRKEMSQLSDKPRLLTVSRRNVATGFPQLLSPFMWIATSSWPKSAGETTSLNI
jgi:hypothetical protein